MSRFSSLKALKQQQKNRRRHYLTLAFISMFFLFARPSPVEAHDWCLAYLPCCLHGDLYACAATAICNAAPNGCFTDCVGQCLASAYDCGQSAAETAIEHAACYAACAVSCI